MLNISQKDVAQYIDTDRYNSFSLLEEGKRAPRVAYFFSGLLVIILIVMFLPWTQNIRSRGVLTALKPEHRPQTVHTTIDGRIEQWYVAEGDYVVPGDTVLRISEIKDAYFDPALVQRVESQVSAKMQSATAYRDKIQALENQLEAMEKTRLNKLQQARNYIMQAKLQVRSDSIDLVAAETNYQIAEKQFGRFEELYNDGLKSLTELEMRKLKFQESQAKLISQENKLMTSRNKLDNAVVELETIENTFQDKIAKTQSDKFTAVSNLYDTEATVTKLRNQLANYSIRQGFYYIEAPQQGYITKAVKTGIGETIKAGEQVVSIMPADAKLAVEMYVKPLDLPLLDKGQDVRFMFDGWPAIVFSGWPNVTYGTFGGEVVAIDRFISSNGKYRVLVAPDPKEEPWPDALQVGTGANGITLLKDVPIWYELWRQLNGFPPDYYKTNGTNNINPPSAQGQKTASAASK